MRIENSSKGQMKESISLQTELGSLMLVTQLQNTARGSAGQKSTGWEALQAGVTCITSQNGVTAQP